MSAETFSDAHDRAVSGLRPWRVNTTGHFEYALDDLFNERIERLREAIWILAMETQMRPEPLARLRELLEVS